MKSLKSIGMVQYFLYEKLDLDIGGNTAFLGPNGTGKTALLDALQIVFLAADSNRTHFNASGEGKKRARTLREYCLGVYGQTETERYRSTSNTYINLVFVHPDTGAAVTAGISLAARADDPDVELNNLYILPGVELSTDQHLERDGSRDTVVPWRHFQHKAADLCRMQGTIPVFTKNRDEFLRRLFVEFLASPGEKPNIRAIKTAFARSLKLNKDVEDLNATLQQHLIEQRPTEVREFRARLEQFREVRELIQRIKERIERASTVADKYAVVQRERSAQSNLECLHAIYETERIGEQLDQIDEQIESLTDQSKEAQLALERATKETQQADAARERAITELNRDPEYLQQANQADRLKNLEENFEEKNTALSNQLTNMLSAVVSASSLDNMAKHQGLFESAANQILDLQQTIRDGQNPQSVALSSAAQAVADAYEIVRKALSAAETEHQNAIDQRRDAKTAWERAQRGLTPLRPMTVALQRHLLDAGISAKPVCDLVKITSPEWQPALEAYLASHVDALIVDRSDEEAAVDVYRGLKGANRVYRVKLALPSRCRSWQIPGAGRFAAQLIAGDDADAVRYLQGELGKLMLADTTAQLRTGAKAISTEGMVSSGGGIERLELPLVDDLKIGRDAHDGFGLAAEHAFREAEKVVSATDGVVKKLQSIQPQLAPFADVNLAHTKLENLFSAAAECKKIVTDLRDALVASQSDRLSILQEKNSDAGERFAKARESENSFRETATRLATQLEYAKSQKQNVQTQLNLASSRETQCRLQPFYNANDVERFRERYDNKHGEDWTARIYACNDAIKHARSRADNADREAWQLFSQFVIDFQLQNHDITSQQWERAYQYILADKLRLEDMELTEQLEKANEAYDAAVKVFRTDVAQVLLEGFEAIDEQINSLNAVLKHAPEFSNRERYQFRYKPVEEHRSLYEFLKRIREHGNAEEDLFGGSGVVPEEFRALVEGDADSALLHDSSPLNDHRRFFTYDVEILKENKSAGFLSKRLGPGSGGEHRTPLYVIFGAALAAAYGKVHGTQGAGGIMLLDEAFEKMDAQNVRATADYLNALGLQLIMAGPETDQPKMSSFLNIYYDMARFGSRTIQMTKNIVMDEARELLQSDNFILHPELIEKEIALLAESENVAG